MRSRASAAGETVTVAAHAAGYGSEARIGAGGDAAHRRLGSDLRAAGAVPEIAAQQRRPQRGEQA